MNKQKKIQIVFFDMEGTLFKGFGKRADGAPSTSAWALLAEKMGPAVNAVEFEHYQKWKRGEYVSYLPWMEDTSALFKRAGMTKEFFDAIISSIEYFPGVKDTLDTLHTAGMRTGLITGGFYEHAERAVRELGLHHVYASCRYFWDENGNLSRWELEENGLQGKISAAQRIASLYDVALENCAFVGDGSNDAHVAGSVGTSVAFNGEEALRRVTTHEVNQEKGKEDFRAVLEYLL